MGLQPTPLAFALFVSGGLSLAIVAFVLGERPKTGATALAVEVFSITLWGFGQATMVAATTRRIAHAGLVLTLLGFVIVGVAWLVFSLQYTGRGDVLDRRVIALLAVEPLAFLALLVTNDAHGLVFANLTMSRGSQLVTYDRGVGLFGHVLYSYAIMGAGHWVLFRKFMASRNVFRKRTFLLMVMSLTLMVVYASSLLGLSPLPYASLGPVAFLAVALVALLVFLGARNLSFLPLERLLALVSSRSKSLTPLARETVIEEMGSGVLVIDHKNRIVDVNSMGKRIIGREGDRIVGRTATSVIPPEIFQTDDTEILDPSVTHGEFSGIWVHTPDGEDRCFDVTVTGLSSDDDEPVGRVAIVHDVTERERRKRKLEERTDELQRRNEQLDRFASVVSHDLRNPLNVANGYVDLAEESGDPEYFEKMRGAHDRMEAIIDDVLAMTRQGGTVEDRAPVELATVARRAWKSVVTDDASVDIAVDEQVNADDGRLRQLFENLFRNACEHNDDDVTVSVGPLEDGFYVADDGVGIEAAERESVLDEGFSTGDGTGLGLSIVETVADAHGWTIDVTESDDGGARFEIHDVRTGDDAFDSRSGVP